MLTPKVFNQNQKRPKTHTIMDMSLLASRYFAATSGLTSADVGPSGSGISKEDAKVVTITDRNLERFLEEKMASVDKFYVKLRTDWGGADYFIDSVCKDLNTETVSEVDVDGKYATYTFCITKKI